MQEKNLLECITDEVKKRLLNFDPKYNPVLVNSDEKNKKYNECKIILLDYLNHQNRIMNQLSIKKYKVVYTKKFWSFINKIDCNDKDELKKIIRSFERKFNNSEDMSEHLSNKAKDLNSNKDLFLDSWKIHHLHLKYNSDRSDYLLLLMIDEYNSKINFITVIKHPEKGKPFFLYKVLKILYDNKLMELAGFVEVKDATIQGILLKNDYDIAKAYEKGINPGFSFDKKTYIHLNGICNNNKNSYNIAMVMHVNWFIKEIKKLNTNDYKFERIDNNFVLGIIKEKENNNHYFKLKNDLTFDEISN